MTEALPAVMTVAELAAFLRCGRNQAYRLLAERRVRSVRVGRGLRIPRVAVEEFLQGADGREVGLSVVSGSGRGAGRSGTA